jgi:DeoR family transcriptional regulator, fructose operon transcriptional repressor
MLKSQRHERILDQLRAEGAVQVSALAAAWKVDPVTIRRDLAQLEQEGRLRRVHGGAVLREIAAAREVAAGLVGRIAEAAARAIPEGSVVFLAPGPLTSEVVPFLRGHAHLTVITNALDAAWQLARQGRHTLHVIGGQVGEGYGIFGDAEALRRVRADVVLLEADGLDAERGLTHDDRETAAMARGLFALGAQTVVLIPPERLGRAGALFVAPAGEIDVLITGREADNLPLWELSELGIRVVLT